MSSMGLALLMAVVLATSACGDGDGGIDRDVEDRVTITTGVFGQLLSGCDTPDCEVGYIVGRGVGATASGTLIAVAVSDEVGFFEIALDPGEYVLEVGDGTSTATFRPWSSPTTATVAADTVVRHDFRSGPGGGSW